MSPYQQLILFHSKAECSRVLRRFCQSTRLRHRTVRRSEALQTALSKKSSKHAFATRGYRTARYCSTVTEHEPARNLPAAGVHTCELKFPRCPRYNVEPSVTRPEGCREACFSTPAKAALFMAPLLQTDTELNLHNVHLLLHWVELKPHHPSFLASQRIPPSSVYVYKGLKKFAGAISRELQRSDVTLTCYVVLG